MSETLHCPRCGHEIDREHPVCPGCGVKLRFRPLNLPKPTDEPVIKIPKAVADKIEPEPSPVPRVPLAPVQSVEDKATPPQTAEENMRKEGHALPQPEGNRWMKSDERAPVSFGEAWFGGWKYSFAGRASRREFWFRQISFVVEGLGVEFVAWLWSSMVDNPVPMLLVWFWLLAAMVPMFALFVRRLHDGGFSGWVGVVRPIAIVLIIMWVLIPSLNRLDLTGGLIPIHYGYGYEYATFQCANIAFWGGFLLSCIQGVVEIVFGVLPGTPGTNKYGPTPYAKTVSTTGAAILPGTGVCQSCGRQLEPGQKFCPGCGKPTVPEKAKCRKCGNELDAGHKYCPKCGAAVVADDSGEQSEAKIGE